MEDRVPHISVRRIPQFTSTILKICETEKRNKCWKQLSGGLLKFLHGVPLRVKIVEDALRPTTTAIVPEQVTQA